MATPSTAKAWPAKTAMTNKENAGNCYARRYRKVAVAIAFSPLNVRKHSGNVGLQSVNALSFPPFRRSAGASAVNADC